MKKLLLTCVFFINSLVMSLVALLIITSLLYYFVIPHVNLPEYITDVPFLFALSFVSTFYIALRWTKTISKLFDIQPVSNR